MLTIRAEQLRALDEVPLVPWLVHTLHMLFPDSAGDLDDPMLGAMVRRSVLRGRSMGFPRDDLLAWVALEHVFGESFLEQPQHDWARRQLEQQRDNPGQALQMLREQAILRLCGESPDPVAGGEPGHG
ncbi:MAG: hypothetical protein KF683_13605 [Rubrivivax sp.]|nr:hypothetical protein [Rubrivivax sp.]